MLIVTWGYALLAVLILGWAAILIAALFRKDKVIEETDIDRNSGDW